MHLGIAQQLQKPFSCAVIGEKIGMLIAVVCDCIRGVCGGCQHFIPHLDCIAEQHCVYAVRRKLMGKTVQTKCGFDQYFRSHFRFVRPPHHGIAQIVDHEDIPVGELHANRTRTLDFYCGGTHLFDLAGIVERRRIDLQMITAKEGENKSYFSSR